MKECYYTNVVFCNILAEWRFGETWFIFDFYGWFLCAIQSPKESTIADIKAKYHERLKEWEGEE